MAGPGRQGIAMTSPYRLVCFSPYPRFSLHALLRKDVPSDLDRCQGVTQHTLPGVEPSSWRT